MEYHLLYFRNYFFLLELAKKFEVKVIIDLNWREVFWEYSSFLSEINKTDRLNLVKKFLNHADCLKLAREEATLFFGHDNPLLISQQISKKPDIVITDGKNPVKWYINGLQGSTDTPNCGDIVDTTGAGDAFLAGLISKFINSGYPSNNLEIENCVKFASICGLLTCFGEGAIETVNYEKVNKFLGSYLVVSPIVYCVTNFNFPKIFNEWFYQFWPFNNNNGFVLYGFFFFIKKNFLTEEIFSNLYKSVK